MLTSIWTIFSDGQVYLALYAWLAAAMLIELVYEDEAVSRWLARTGMLAIVLLIGFRWETGTDWMPYFRIYYTNETSSDYDSAVFGVDQGYILFNYLMRYIIDNYTVFLLVDAIIAVGAVYIFIEKGTKLPNMAVYLFYTSYSITHFMGSNRRMLAIGLVCLSFLTLARKKQMVEGWHRWAVPIGLAATLHRTSLAVLPGLFVSRRAWPTALVILGLLASLGLGVAGVPLAGLEMLGGLLSEYAGITAVEKLIFYTSDEVQLDPNFDVMRQAALGVAKRSSVLIILIAYMHYGKPSEFAQRLYNVYIIGCATYFSLIGGPIFQIISTYYSIVEIVLIPIVFHDLYRYKVLYSMYLLVVPLLLLLSSLTPYLDLYVPYWSIFS